MALSCTWKLLFNNFKFESEVKIKWLFETYQPSSIAALLCLHFICQRWLSQGTYFIAHITMSTVETLVTNTIVQLPPKISDFVVQKSNAILTHLLLAKFLISKFYWPVANYIISE